MLNALGSRRIFFRTAKAVYRTSHAASAPVHQSPNSCAQCQTRTRRFRSYCRSP